MIHYEYVQEISYELLTIENTLNCILKFFPSEEQIEEEAEKAKVAEDVVEEEVEVIDEEEVVQEAEEKIRYLCIACVRHMYKFVHNINIFYMQDPYPKLIEIKFFEIIFLCL